MRLRLRDDVYLAPSADGLRVLTHRGLARIDGTSIARWVDRLVPYLDGRYTIEQLTAGLPPDREQAVKRVVEILRTCDALEGEPDAGFAARAVVVAGAEPALGHLVRAVSASGLRDITVVDLSSAAVIDLPAADLVFYAGDGQGALRLQRVCEERAIPLALLVATSEATWLLPPGAPGWDDVAYRMGDGAEQGGIVPPGAAATLVQAARRELTGAMPPGERGRVVRIALDTWRHTRHSCLPRPRPGSARSREMFLQRVRTLLAGEPLDHGSFLRRVAPCVNGHLGVVRLVDADEPQVVVNTCRAVLPDGEAEVGSGFGHEAARRDAVRRALAAYAARTVDPGRLTGSGVWAHEIDRPDRARLIPADAVFDGERAGLAAGDSWEHALGEGLAGRCLQLITAGFGSRTEPFPRIDVTAVDLHEEGHRCRDVLIRSGELPEVYDLTGSLEVPAFAFCAGEVTIGHFAGLDPAEALGEGLRSALVRLQSPQDGHAEPLPARLRGPSRRASPRPADLEQVASRLRARGRVALAVPLDHDEAVSSIMPYLTRVVVTDA
ncbi:hypothetical protein [Nonomuraea soli]|uniref:YcaO domain-containing protein n=1 Tax=Nonomuraea soli TaxID=1032476 RepID=A0A7W0CQD7_9ACTN|nr:hypothetical protein [Nonomuraea soli]MBA2895393.1 hypothetical protein [Nonomuraea soli]